jgi:hypothetical protein
MIFDLYLDLDVLKAIERFVTVFQTEICKETVVHKMVEFYAKIKGLH